MDDREIVAAIAAGDPAGLADAYGKYAESLFGYCCWMLGEPDDAAGAVLDTFVIADSRLGELGDPRKLRPWLYAVARNECLGRLGPEQPGTDEAAELADPPADAGDSDERAELRRLIRAALGSLNPGDREVIELDLRHDLHGADLAAVLGVPRNQAHAMASRARGQLEKALGALLVARTGRRACPELDLLLDGWDGELTALTRKRVGRHIDQCAVCADRRDGALRPVALYGMAPPAALPPGLREEILRLCADADPEAESYRQDVTEQAGPFRPSGFPEPARPPRRGRALAGIAAAAGVVIAVAATGIVTVLALTGSHSPRPADAARPGSASGAVSAGSAGSEPAGQVPATLPPPTSESAAPGTSSAATSASASATAKPKPSPSPSATSPTPPTPRPSIPTPSARPSFTIPGGPSTPAVPTR